MISSFFLFFSFFVFFCCAAFQHKILALKNSLSLSFTFALIFSSSLLCYLFLNSFPAWILQFFMFCPVFFSHSSFYFFPAPQLDRPSFSLTHRIPPPRLFIAILLSSSIHLGDLSLLFFPSLRSYSYLSSPLSAFIGLRCPAAAIAESGSLHIWG